MVDMDFANLTNEQLEAKLLELAYDESLGGRHVESRKSAIRVVLARREARREATDVDAIIAEAVRLVNAVRPPDRQVTAEDMNLPDAHCVVMAPAGWVPLFSTPAEDEEVARRRRQRTWHPRLPDGGPDEPHTATGCPFCAEAATELAEGSGSGLGECAPVAGPIAGGAMPPLGAGRAAKSTDRQEEE